MKVRSIAALVILAATAMWGQSSAGPLATRRQTVVANSNAEGLATAARAKQVANQHLQEMGATLSKMHALLKGMQAKTSATKDPMAKSNLEMWSLMLDELDKQYAQLVSSAKAREDLEARRKVMYQQAEDRAAAARAQHAEAPAAASLAPAPESRPAVAPAAAESMPTPTATAPASSPN